MSKNVTRLYAQFHPENYQLSLTLDKHALTFSGTVIIKGKKVGRPSQRLTFHQNELKIAQATITKHDKRSDAEIPVDRINLQQKLNEVRLHAAGMLTPGEYTISMKFAGKITDAMNGLYPSRYEIDGKKDIILGTQFESHHAREVFPCIDEPEAKATFDMAITASKDDVILANTPQVSETVDGKTKTAIFETTPIMSSYLVAFVAGDLKFHEATTKDNVHIRVFATPDKVDQVDFGLDVAVKTLEFYNDYFAIDYPLPKLDMVALPDFAAGAMENWGLVTYREHCLLVDAEHTSLPTKEYVAMVVAHELAHQWFGNLVTMRWWTDLWLNEGFASWIEYLAVDHIFPDWQMWTQFIAEEQQVALRLDALEHTHPVEVPVHHPDEIRTIFDSISYAKGSSVILMLHDWLGPTVFRDGLRKYLKRHAYQNTDTVDLWASLSEVSGKNVAAFMKHWTGESGFPVVQLKGSTMHQERFYVAKPSRKASTLWHVPLLSETKVDAETMTTKELQLPEKTLLNKGRSGFYRVAYDAEMSHQLAAQVANGQLAPVDRLGLLSDSFEVAKAGYGSTVDALELLATYEDEDNAAVWDAIATALSDVRSVMGTDDELREAMKPFIRRLVSKELARLGWEPAKNESHFDTLLRPTILGLAAFADVPEVLAEAQKRYQTMKRPEDIAPDLRSVIWNTVARFGDQKDYDRFLRLHNASNNSEVRVTLSAALTGFQDPKLAKRSLDMIKTDVVRNQDAAYWIVHALTNRHARDVAWEWLQDNWDWWHKTMGTDLSFSRTPMFAARVFTGEDRLNAFEKFFEPKRSPTLDRAINQGLEVIRWHTDWYNRDYAAVLEYFKALE